MAQISPETLTLKQMQNLDNMFKCYFEMETLNVQNEYKKLEQNPEADPDHFNYLGNWLDDKFKELLIESGLYDIYWYLRDRERYIREHEVHYSEDDFDDDELDDVTIKYYDDDCAPRYFLNN